MEMASDYTRPRQTRESIAFWKLGTLSPLAFLPQGTSPYESQTDPEKPEMHDIRINAVD